MKRRINHTILLAEVMLAFLFAACTNDNPVSGSGEGDASVRLFLKMPGGGGGGTTRSISPTPGDENRIDVVHVLSFAQDAGNDWTYRYTATGVSISPTPGGNANDMTVMAKVVAMNQPQRFVVLANSAAELAGAPLVPGKKLADVKHGIVCSTGGGEWPANNNGSGGFTPFPMYAITNPETVNANTSHHIGTYPMIRMVARIDVVLHSSIAAGDFKLKDACLFNYKTAGYVPYFDSNFSTDRVTAPAVPAIGDHSGTPILHPAVHYEADYGTDPRGEIICSIYPFESEAITAEADRARKTALVIGGYYRGSTAKTYYRIDLKGSTDPSPGISGGILRNHLYKVEVQSVAGEGYATDKDAYLGESRLAAEVMPWNLAGQDVIVDGQFYLNVATDGERVIKRWEPDSQLNVKSETDYDITSQGFPKGIWIDAQQIKYSPAVTPGNRWIKITDLSGGNGDLDREFVLEADRTKVPVNRYSATARVPVRAGNLTHIIDITCINEYYPDMHNGWAGCNIYWDGEKLTFDEVDDHGNEQYQGVFFQWGSLYGISPLNPYGGWTILYPPSGVSGTAGDMGFAVWGSLPRAPEVVVNSHPPTGKNLMDRAYLYEINTGDEGATGIGDICKYLTARGWAPAGKWRMPTATEIGEDGGAYTRSPPPWTDFQVTTATGTDRIAKGVTKNDIGMPFFPAAGYVPHDGNFGFNNPGKGTQYWSASFSSNIGGWSLQVTPNQIFAPGAVNRKNGFSVRCVAE